MRKADHKFYLEIVRWKIQCPIITMNFYAYILDKQSMLKSLRALKAYFLLFLFIWNCSCLESTQPYRLSEVLDYPNVFNQNSDLSVIVLSCGGKRKLQLTIKSFFYFNTYQIKKFYIVHCAMQSIPISLMTPFGYDSHKQFFDVTGATDEEDSIIEALSNVYQKINTKYIYQTDGQWVMTKGFGFIEKSISLLAQSEQLSMKISQVVSNYPYWRSMARLSPMKWTKAGDAYHEIFAFTPQKYSYFSLSPSVIHFETLYYILKGAGLKKMCLNSACKQQIKSKYQYDKCCLWEFGQSISKMGYSQVYLNDGTGEPNHQFIRQ